MIKLYKYNRENISLRFHVRNDPVYCIAFFIINKTRTCCSQFAQ